MLVALRFELCQPESPASDRGGTFRMPSYLACYRPALSSLLMRFDESQASLNSCQICQPLDRLEPALWLSSTWVELAGWVKVGVLNSLANYT
jgi:hypothetical protein